MQHPTMLVWISTAILAGVLQGAVPTEASAQPPSLTRELDGPPRGDRYLEHFQIYFTVNGLGANHTMTPAIPAGKKLVLQAVNMHSLVTNGQNLMQARVVINPGRTPLAFLYVDMDFQAENTEYIPSQRQRHFTGHRDINMVLNAGESVAVNFLRNGPLGDAFANYSRVTFIGYFVDVDPLTPPGP